MSDQTRVTRRCVVLVIGLAGCVPGATLAPQDAGPEDTGRPGDSGQDTSVAPTDSGADAVSEVVSSCDAGPVCAGHCVDLATDGNNCGVCGHDCQGGACASGTCQPVVLASGQSLPFSVAVDATSVYWSSAAAVEPDGGLVNGATGTIMKCPVAGCNGQPVQLASGQSFPWWLTISGGSLFWSTTTNDPGTGQVVTCAVGGCNNAPGIVATGLTYPSEVAADATNVYWEGVTDDPADGGPRTVSVLECSLGGCSNQPTVLAPVTGEGIYDTTNITVGAGSVYWTTTDGLFSCGVSGCNQQPAVLADAGNPAGVAVDATRLYWTTAVGDSVLSCDVGNCGTPPTTIASGQAHPLLVSVFGNSVYWVNDDGAPSTIMTCAASGCSGPAVQLAAVQERIGGLAVDANSVYWTNTHSGTVMKVAR